MKWGREWNLYKEQPMRAVRETDLACKMLGRFVVASAAILPSRLLLLVKLPSFVSLSTLIKTIKKSPIKGGFFNGANRETRTPDPLITNQ